jgi:hypothetical protein
VVFDGGLDADQLTDGDQRTAPTLDAQTTQTIEIRAGSPIGAEDDGHVLAGALVVQNSPSQR